MLFRSEEEETEIVSKLESKNYGDLNVYLYEQFKLFCDENKENMDEIYVAINEKIASKSVADAAVPAKVKLIKAGNIHEILENRIAVANDKNEKIKLSKKKAS